MAYDQHTADIEGENQRLRDALEYVLRADRSKDYEYGEKRRDGEKPKAGSRWLTPREKAIVELRLSPLVSQDNNSDSTKP